MNIDVCTDRFHIRTVIPSDKDSFMSLRVKTSDMAKAYELYPEFREHEWQCVLEAEDEISMMVFRREAETFVAICNFQDFQDDHVDIGYDIEEEYRGKGIGTKLVIDLVSLAHAVFPEKAVIARIRARNSASCRVAEKAGGILLYCDPTPEAKVFAESLEKYGDGKVDEKGNRATEEEISAWKRVVDEGKEGIRVYKMS